MTQTSTVQRIMVKRAGCKLLGRAQRERSFKRFWQFPLAKEVEGLATRKTRNGAKDICCPWTVNTIEFDAGF